MLDWLKNWFIKPKPSKPKSMEEMVMEIQAGIRSGKLKTTSFFQDRVDPSVYGKYINSNNMIEGIRQ